MHLFHPWVLGVGAVIILAAFLIHQQRASATDKKVTKESVWLSYVKGKAMVRTIIALLGAGVIGLIAWTVWKTSDLENIFFHLNVQVVAVIAVGLVLLYAASYLPSEDGPRKAIRFLVYCGAIVALALIAIPLLTQYQLRHDADARRAAAAAEKAHVADLKAAQAEMRRQQAICGANGQPDCTCQGLKMAMRTLAPGERIIMAPVFGMRWTFDPAPSPLTFRYRNADLPDATWIDNNHTELRDAAHVEVQNLEPGNLRLYCHYV